MQKGFILPIGETIKRKSYPVATVSLIGVNCFIFFAQLLFGFDKIIMEFGFTPANPTPLTFISSLFLHGNLFHLLGNMYFLWLFGDNVEDVMGKGKFLFLFFGAGLGANWLHLVLNFGSHVPLIGASGAISGVLAAYLLFFRHARLEVFTTLTVIPFLFKMRVWVYGLFWFGFQFFYSVLVLAGASYATAYFAHVGGFFTGLLLAYILAYKGVEGKDYIESGAKNVIKSELLENLRLRYPSSRIRVNNVWRKDNELFALANVDNFNIQYKVNENGDILKELN